MNSEPSKHTCPHCSKPISERAAHLQAQPIPSYVCSKAISERTAYLQAHPIPGCAKCEVAVRLYAAHLREELARIEAALAKCSRQQ